MGKRDWTNYSEIKFSKELLLPNFPKYRYETRYSFFLPAADSSPCVCFTRTCIGALNSANLLPWTTRGAETPVPGRAQRANVTFTLHSFPNFTTWLYVVKIDTGNWCVRAKGAKYRERKLSANLSFRPFPRVSSNFKNIYFQYYDILLHSPFLPYSLYPFTRVFLA